MNYFNLAKSKKLLKTLLNIVVFTFCISQTHRQLRLVTLRKMVDRSVSFRATTGSKGKRPRQVRDLTIPVYPLMVSNLNDLFTFGQIGDEN